jgi:phenylacetate-CoA ligase
MSNDFNRLKKAAKSLLRPAYYRLPKRICYGQEYFRVMALLDESQYWDENRLAEYQLSKLRRMLRHAARNIPYYRKLFRSVGFDPDTVRHANDINVLPLLDKDIIRRNLHDLLAENISSRQMLYFTTSGTMGEPLGVYNLSSSRGRERAFIYKLWSRVGFRPGDGRAMLRGWPVKKKRRWQYEPSESCYIFSNFHMTPENVASYADVIKEKKLPFLHSYPSAVKDLARHLNDLGIEPPSFKAILASSENIYPGQREFIEGFFGARMFSWYGHTENTILAGECEISNNYHVYPEYGLAEVLREDGSVAEGEGESGELVGTSLDNLAMPLIRYRTGDWATIGPKNCACGRHYQLLKETHGRWRQEMLVGKLDNLISVTAVNLHADEFDRVHRIQFYQCEKGRVELRISPLPDYTAEDSRRILDSLNKKMGDTMDISLVCCSEIPLMPGGKFRLVVSDLRLPGSAVEVGRE